MEEEKCCPKCGECENIHSNYDWSQENITIKEFLCNECATYFKSNEQE
jgi:formate dehydrogenase maturation protein FdhE